MRRKGDALTGEGRGSCSRSRVVFTQDEIGIDVFRDVAAEALPKLEHPGEGNHGGVVGGEADWAGLELESMGFRSEEHTSELQSRRNLVCRLLLEKKKT